MVVVLGHVFFGFHKRRPGLGECGVHLVLEFIDSLKSGIYLMWFEAHLWVPASVEHERSLLGGGMHMVVLLELG